MKRISVLLLCLLFTIFYPQAGNLLASHFCSLFGITWFYVHHFVQLILALATILLFVYFFARKPLSDWGFSLTNWRWSLLTSIKFAAGWILVSVVLNLLFAFENHIQYERSFLNITADLFFDIIITPLSEEILFRGLIMSLIIFYWPGKIIIGKLKISYAVIFSTLFFCLAHVGINLKNLSIDNIDVMQLMFTLGLGIFYAYMREKTGSLLGPLIAHGISDGSITVIQLILL